MKRLVVLFSGEGSNLLNLIQTLHQGPCTIVCALTNNPHARGIAKAQAHQIPVIVLDHRAFESREAYDRALVERLTPYAPDLVVLAGFMRIITPVFVDAFDIINIHPSFLPDFKGSHAIERSFAHGEYGGVSVHWVSEELDGGEIILQERLDKRANETLESFTEAIHSLEYRLYPEAIRRVLGL